jgi:putative copper export protein
MFEWTLIRFLHVVAIGFFVGGQLMLATVVVPALRGQDRQLMRGAAKRFGIASLAALAVIIATGVAMASEFDRWGEPELQAKLALLVLVFVLAGLHVVTPYTRLISVAVLVTSIAIVWFGVDLAH